MIYLDQAATRYPRPQAVRQAVHQAVDAPWGNPGRSGHELALSAGRAVFDARVNVAEHLKVDPLEIIFTSSCTDALNLLVHGLPDGLRVITTEVEHNSLLRPLRARAGRGELQLQYAAVDPAGRVDVRRGCPAGEVVLVSAASNVLAGRNSLETLRAWAGHDKWLMIDGAQLVGEVDPGSYVAFADAIAAPGHKALGGPPGSGFAWVRPQVGLRPWRQGGTGAHSESPEQPDDRPDGFEAGSQNLWGIVGLGVAAKICDPALWRPAEELAQQLRTALSHSGRYRVLGAVSGDCAPLVSFVPLHVQGDVNELGMQLWQQHRIAVRTGLHCAPGAHQFVGSLTSGAVRASFGPEHTEDDLRALLYALGLE